MIRRTGGCLCGAVRFETTGEPLNVRLCHCRQCQRAMGSPFFARALFPQSRIRITGATAGHATSPGLERRFCPACGCRIMASRTDGSRSGLALALFDDPDAFSPECHMFTAEKVGWLKLADGLPQYPGRPPG